MDEKPCEHFWLKRYDTLQLRDRAWCEKCGEWRELDEPYIDPMTGVVQEPR